MARGTELVTCRMGCPVQGYSREDSSVTQTHSGSPADIHWLQEDVGFLGKKGMGRAKLWMAAWKLG